MEIDLEEPTRPQIAAMRDDVAKASNAATRNSRRLIIGRVGRFR